MQSSLKTVLLAILLVLSVTAVSQVTEEYYESGALQFEYSYRNGKLHGLTKEYYETGELKAESDYRADKLVAQKIFRRDGNLEYELKSKDGQKIETRKMYYPTGELSREQSFVNGKLEGLEFDYYQDGQKKAERHYVNGQRDGSAKGYHMNGKVQGDWLFQNGNPVSATLFYSTGEKWLVHTDFDKKGRLNGTSKEYDKKGTLMALRYYEENEMVKRRRIGSWSRWWWELWY
ncbi:MAG: toxin-antitoxin system YwqK family antitoxin [Pseudomonadota bacterium]